MTATKLCYDLRCCAAELRLMTDLCETQRMLEAMNKAVQVMSEADRYITTLDERRWDG